MKKLIIIMLIAGVLLPACMNRADSRNGVAETDRIDLIDAPEVEGMAFIQGGRYLSQIDFDSAEIVVEPFYMDKYPVSISQFADFIEESGYIPASDRPGSVTAVLGSGRIVGMKGINWRCDERGRPRDSSDYHYPVIYVSYEDAEAYAEWTGKRLPTIYEWEYTALTGIGTADPYVYVRNNAWHEKNSKAIQAPGMMAPDIYGIFDLIGNVDEIVNLGSYTLTHVPADFRAEDLIRTSVSSFFNDPDYLYPFTFSLTGRGTTGFNTGFRCAKDFIE